MKRIALLVAIGVLATAASVSAQVTSNTNAVTGGIFKQDGDYLVDSVNFLKVKKGTWVLSLGTQGSSGASNGDQRVTGGNGNLFGDFFYLGNAFSLAGVTNTGNVSSGNNEVQNSATTSTFNSTTYAYTGKSVTTADKKNWTESSDNTWTTLLGFGQIGSLAGSVTYTPNKTYGDYSLAKTMDASGKLTGTKDTNGSTATQTYDAAGTLYAENGTKYTLGSVDTSGVSGWLAYGNSIALGGITIKGQLKVTANSTAASSSAGYTSYNKSYNTGLPNNTSYSKVYSEQYNGNVSTLTPSGFVAVDTALDKATLTAQVTYSLDLPTYANSYNDATGASQTGGVANYSTTTTTTVTSTSGVLSQNAVTARYWFNDNITMSTNTITPKLQFKAPLSDAFSFGVSYVPVITLTNENHQKSTATTTTTVYTANLAQATPASDYTSVNSTAASGYSKASNTFTWTNPVTLAGQFVAIPSLLTFNAGVSVALPAFTTVTTTESNTGVKTDTTVKTFGDGTVIKTANAPTTVQGSDFTTTPASQTDTQANQNSIAGTSATLRLGAVYNLTADTYADLGILTSSNVIGIYSVTLQLTSRY